MPRSRAAALAERSYRSPVWESEAQRCYSCGSCNLVCPTCYCFDIQDENDLPVDTGVRERCWDACMLRDFALVAGNHNFRPQAAQRLRHRVLRKMAWIEGRTGLAGCVGCGRCDRACTARISIVEIMKRLAQEGEHVHR
jgi:Fe-S-cluster-containing hydrogenase component 2